MSNNNTLNKTLYFKILYIILETFVNQINQNELMKVISKPAHANGKH